MCDDLVIVKPLINACQHITIFTPMLCINVTITSINTVNDSFYSKTFFKVNLDLELLSEYYIEYFHSFNILTKLEFMQSIYFIFFQVLRLSPYKYQHIYQIYQLLLSKCVTSSYCSVNSAFCLKASAED